MVTNETNDFHSAGKFQVKLFATHPRQRESQYLRGYVYSNMEIADDNPVSVDLNLT